MNKKFALLAVFLVLLLGIAQAQEEPLDLNDETVRINYSLGSQIGGDFKRQGVDMDPEAVRCTRSW